MLLRHCCQLRDPILCDATLLIGRFWGHQRVHEVSFPREDYRMLTFPSLGCPFENSSLQLHNHIYRI